MYKLYRAKFLLVDLFKFVPNHCDSILRFDKSLQHILTNDDARAVRLFSEDPHNTFFKVDDEVKVNNHMGEHSTEYNFVCACGSQN